MPFKPGKENYNNTEGPWNRGSRDWKKEMIETASRLQMCVLYPQELTAHARVRCSCPHGVVKDTTVHKFVIRQYCCKSQASKAHGREMKRLAAMESPGLKVRPEQINEPGVLYLIRYLDEDGTHFKIGITKRSLSERFKPHQLISILATHQATLGECFDLEQSLLKWAKSQGYRYSSPTTTELLLPAAISHVLSELKQCTFKSPASPSSSGAW